MATLPSIPKHSDYPALWGGWGLGAFGGGTEKFKTRQAAGP